MGWAIATARPEPAKPGLPRPERGRPVLPSTFVSRLGRLLIGLNFLALAVLIVGALVLNESRRGLVEARLDSLNTQGAFIANVIAKAATVGEPEPELIAPRAAQTIQLLFLSRSQRARLFDKDGTLITDSSVIADRIQQQPLPPARKPGEAGFRWPWQKPREVRDAEMHARAVAALDREVSMAMKGSPEAELRPSDDGRRVVSVSIPIQHVQAVLGVLTLEAGDVDQIVAAQRWALAPFILIAIAVTLASSLLANLLVARPIMRLSRAADSVRLSRARTMSLPDLADRDDEVGDLTRSLEAMTSALSDRMDAIDRFAADVSHEIKNPLTSIRSAVETLELAPTPAAQARLLPILKHDVGRLDRLITDISNASRLDAELSRDAPRAIDLDALLRDLSELYGATRRGGEADVTYAGPAAPLRVFGREGPLSQVFRNLIDNARSFSPPGGSVNLTARREPGRGIVIAVEDEGPGLPPDNLESVFERFYTQRPKGQPGAGASFGGHSGLGLSIARQIVEAHGGRITAENRVGVDGGVVGARFLIVLPEATAPRLDRGNERA